MNKKFKFFYKNKNDLYNYENLFKQKVFCIPVLEKAKNYFFLIKKYELIKNFKNTIFLMAGGKGKRLYPLTKNTPKPMLKIKDVPIIERVIVNFKEQGFTNFVISINYLGSKIKKYLKNGERLNVKIEYIEEKKFLGTAGSLSLLNKNKINFPIILTNSDLISNIDYEELLSFHLKNKSDLTVCVKNQIFEMPYGEIRLNARKINKIVEKPYSNSIINAGVYVLSKTVLKYLIINKKLMMNDLINKLIEKKGKVLSFPIYENWIDVGNKDQLKIARS